MKKILFKRISAGKYRGLKGYVASLGGTLALGGRAMDGSSWPSGEGWALPVTSSCPPAPVPRLGSSRAGGGEGKGRASCTPGSQEVSFPQDSCFLYRGRKRAGRD